MPSPSPPSTGRSAAAIQKLRSLSNKRVIGCNRRRRRKAAEEVIVVVERGGGGVSAVSPQSRTMQKFAENQARGGGAANLAHPLSNLRKKKTTPQNQAREMSQSETALVVIRQAIEHNNAQNHNQQANRDDNQQHEAKPAEHHSAGPDAALDGAVAEVLRDGGGGDRGRVLP